MQKTLGEQARENSAISKEKREEEINLMLFLTKNFLSKKILDVSRKTTKKYFCVSREELLSFNTSQEKLSMAEFSKFIFDLFLYFKREEIRLTRRNSNFKFSWN